jgi:hypothetical protein
MPIRFDRHQMRHLSTISILLLATGRSFRVQRGSVRWHFVSATLEVPQQGVVHSSWTFVACLV